MAMANSGTRAAKLADRIRVIVAETLKNRVKDPRLGFVTITDVRITGDLREATVFYTVYGDEEARAESTAALESAKGILRTEVGRQTGVKHTPSLTFIPDAIPEGARNIEDLLAKVALSDAEVRDKAAAAQYAGEPDPYRVPRDLDDDADDAADSAADPAAADAAHGPDAEKEE
jgi:ribosome-binding factor A